MMPKRKLPDPNHHNSGRLPNFNQSLTQHLSFANFTLKRFAGNISAAERLLSGDRRDSSYRDLPMQDQDKIATTAFRLRQLAMELKDLADDIAEFNRDKTKLKLPPTKKLPMRGG